MDKSNVKIRGYKDGLHLIIFPKASINEIKDAVDDMMENMNQSLTGSSIQIDIKPSTFAPEDIRKLEQHLTDEYELDVNGVNIIGEKIESPIKAAPATHIISHSLTSQSLPELEQAHIIRQTIRSGQTKTYLSGSIIIYGDVNPGGEVVSSGDIIVMGALRGNAHAGANGKLSSVIVALELVPLQLQIGAYVNRPPVGQKPRGYPEIARVGAEDIIIVEEFIKF